MNKINRGPDPYSLTTFGKLLDPLADKLLIIAALISLVSLHRLAAWIAMVIITRELAVTVLDVQGNWDHIQVVMSEKTSRQGWAYGSYIGDTGRNTDAKP